MTSSVKAAVQSVGVRLYCLARIKTMGQLKVMKVLMQVHGQLCTRSSAPPLLRTIVSKRSLFELVLVSIHSTVRPCP